MRQLLAAVAALIAAGAASAQYPSVAAVAGAPMGPGPGAVVVNGQSRLPQVGGYFMSNAAYGETSRNNAAGSVYSDHAFAFGSTRSFFAPCGPYVGPTCKGLFGRKSACPPCPTCEYGTYGNK